MEDLDENDEVAELIEEATELEVVLQPARDVDVSNENDAGSDIEGEIRDLGRGILARPAEIRRITTTATDGKTQQELIGNDGVLVASNPPTGEQNTNRQLAKKRKKVRK